MLRFKGVRSGLLIRFTTIEEFSIIFSEEEFTTSDFSKYCVFRVTVGAIEAE